MDCREIEKNLTNALGLELDTSLKCSVEEHLATCTNCQEFAASLNWLRAGIQHARSPAPSTELYEKTRSRCHAVLDEVAVTRIGRVKEKINIPTFIWLALVGLLILTRLFATSLFADSSFDKVLNVNTAMVLVIFIENILMLLFSPIIFKKFAHRNNWAGIV